MGDLTQNLTRGGTTNLPADTRSKAEKWRKVRLIQFDLDFPSRKLVEMCDHLWGLICVRRARRDTISGEGRMPRCSDGPTQGCPAGNYPPGTLYSGENYP